MKKPEWETASILTMLVVLSAVVTGITGFSTEAKAASVDAQVVLEEDIKNGEGYNISVSGQSLGASCGPTLRVLERDSGLFGGSTRELVSVPSEELDIGLNGEFTKEIRLNMEGAWDNDEDPSDGAELRVELQVDSILCDSASTEFSTMEIRPADSEKPDPVKTVDYPSNVDTGENFEISVTGTNTGGHVGEFSTIQIELRELDEDSDGQYMGNPSGGPGDLITIEKGREVGTKPGASVDDEADYWQAELAFGPEEFYMAGEDTAELSVSVTAPPKDDDGDGVNEQYEFEFLTRVSLPLDTDQNSPETWFSDSQETTDDQGHYAQSHTITVDGPDECPDEKGDGDDIDPGCWENPPPKDVSLNGGSITEGDQITLTATGTDPEGKGLSYEWSLEGPGSLSGNGASVTYSAPNSPAGITSDTDVQVTVTAIEGDERKTASASATVSISDINPSPTVSLSGATVEGGQQVTLEASGNNPEGDGLSYSWSLDGEGQLSPSGSSATYTAPSLITSDMTVSVSVTAEESEGKRSSASAQITVQANDPDGDDIPNADDQCDNSAEDGDRYNENDGCPENPPPSVGLNDDSVNEGETITLTADGNDPEGDSLSYEWSLESGDGSLSGNGQSITYEAPSAVSADSSATVSVTATEPDGPKSAQALATITIQNTAPENADGDGWSNTEDPNPNNPNTDNTWLEDGVKGEDKADIDNDGSPNYADSDNDGDGYTDGKEADAGTDQNNASSHPSDTTPTVTASGGSGTPDGTVTVSLSVENAQTAELSNIPTDWSVVDKTTGGATFDNGVADGNDYLGWVWNSDQSSKSVSVTFDIPSGASTTDYTLTATAEDSNGDTSDTTATVSISGSIVDTYDTNGEPGIQIDELNTGIDDYFNEGITIQQLNQLIDAYFGQLNAALRRADL